MKRCGAYRMDVGESIYIGSSTDIDYRRASHVTMLRKGEHPNHKLQAAWDLNPEKVTSTNLRPLFKLDGESVEDFRDRLRAAEQELLDHFKDDERLTNLSLNARGPDNLTTLRNKWRDPEFREKMMGMLKNRKFSAESRAKMAEAKRGMLNPKSRPVRVTWPDGRDEVFSSGSDAARHLKVSQQLVASWLKGLVPMPGQGKRCRKYWLEGVVVSYAD